MNCVDTRFDHIFDHAVAKIVTTTMQNERFPVVMGNFRVFLEPREHVLTKIRRGKYRSRLVAKIVRMPEGANAVIVHYVLVVMKDYLAPAIENCLNKGRIVGEVVEKSTISQQVL